MRSLHALSIEDAGRLKAVNFDSIISTNIESIFAADLLLNSNIKQRNNSGKS